MLSWMDRDALEKTNEVGKGVACDISRWLECKGVLLGKGHETVKIL